VLSLWGTNWPERWGLGYAERAKEITASLSCWQLSIGTLLSWTPLVQRQSIGLLRCQGEYFCVDLICRKHLLACVNSSVEIRWNPARTARSLGRSVTGVSFGWGRLPRGDDSLGCRASTQSDKSLYLWTRWRVARAIMSRKVPYAWTRFWDFCRSKDSRANA